MEEVNGMSQKAHVVKDPIIIGQKSGELVAELGYWDKRPAIVLKAKQPRSNNADTRYLIPLDQIWMYSEDHYEQVTDKMPKTFESFMLHKCLDLYELFDLGTPSSRQLAEVAWLIQDSIDQLMKMPPLELPKKVVGEATATMQPMDGSEGVTFTTEVKEDDLAQ
jgi:hypothetical protein